MITIKTILWTNDVDKIGDKATEKALQQLAENCVGQPVTYEFNHERPIGKIVGAEYTPRQVTAEIEITDKEIVNPIKSGDLEYVGVGGTITKYYLENDIFCIDGFDPTSHAIVKEPVCDKWRIIEVDGVEVKAEDMTEVLN